MIARSTRIKCFGDWKLKIFANSNIRLALLGIFQIFFFFHLPIWCQNNCNSSTNDNRDNIKNKDTTANNNNINSNDNNPMTSKQRRRNIIWFNPPSSKNEARKIGRYFLKLIYKDFPRDHQFHKSFNRNNIKLSYSCMPNSKSAINSHNRKILHPPVSNQRRTCNCINKTDCLLQEKCLWENTQHQADISSGNFQMKIYYNIIRNKI